MEEVDRELREQQVPITARELKAIGAVRRRLEIIGDIYLSGLPKWPREGSYEGADLTVRIVRWMKDRYGNKLNIRLPGQTMIAIRGDPYRVRLPIAFGNINVICDPSQMGIPLPAFGVSAPPIVNCLDLVDELSVSLAGSLTHVELQDILSDIAVGVRYALILTAIKPIPLVHKANGDLASSVDDALRAPPDFGGSRWHSLQAAEKFLKALLTIQGISYPKVHDVARLANLAVASVQIEQALLKEVQCTAAVRYSEDGSSLRDAHRAHRSAVLICEKVAKRLPSWSS
jgi:hypothetical protein